MPAVFISYSRQDKEFVARLHEALSARQYDVWVDWDDIPPVAQWFDEIRAGVRGADGFIYVISPDSVSSQVCGRELEEAVEQRKRIVPILHREPGGARVPSAAAELNWILLRDSDDFEHGVAQLLEAMEQDLEHLRAHTRLGVAANRWHAGGREPSQLLRGGELSAAEAWLVGGSDKQPQATPLQRRYVLASRQAATRRQRALIGAVSLALLITIVLTVVALVQRSDAIHERNVALARQLDADALAEYQKDPELSVLLAVKAARVDAGSATEEALREALAQSHVRVRYSLASVTAGDALWSPNGTRLLVTSPGRRGWARIYSPGTRVPPVTPADGAAPAFTGQSSWDARGDRVVIGGDRPGVYDARTGRLVTRLSGSARYAALTPDGTAAVTVDAQSVGHVFDVATGRQVARFQPRLHAGTTCFALSPDGTVAAQCDSASLALDGSSAAALDVWNTRTGRVLYSIPYPQTITGAGFSPDGRLLAVTTLGHTTTGTLLDQAKASSAPGTFVYDTANGRLVTEFAGGASAVAFAPLDPPFEELAYASSSNDLVWVYDFATRGLKPLSGNTDVVDSLSFSPDGAELVAGSRDDDARVYDVTANGAQPVEVLAGHSARVLSASFGHGGTMIATTAEDGTTRLWASPIPHPEAFLPASTSTASEDVHVASIAFTAAGSRIVQAGTEGHGQVLEARSMRVLARFAAPPGQGFARAWPARNGRVIATLAGPLNSHGIPSLATSAELFNASSGALIKAITPLKPGPLINGALDYKGERLVTLGLNGSADAWAIPTGRLLYHLPGSTPAAAAAFSNDGTTLAIVHYPTLPRAVTSATVFGEVMIDIYDASNGRLERTIRGDVLVPQEPGSALYAPLSVAFSPDGRLLAVAGADPSIEIYDPRTGTEVKHLGLLGSPDGDYVGSLAFSPNGALLAAGAASGAYVWRVSSFTRLAGSFQNIAAGDTSPYIGGGFGVAVGFSNDSRWLSLSGDFAVSIFDPLDDLELAHAETLDSAAVSPGGQEWVTSAASGVAAYPCELCTGLDGLLALAERNTTRSLTPGERAHFLGRG